MIPADWLLYEDAIRSVEGPDASRGGPEGTARCEETGNGKT